MKRTLIVALTAATAFAGAAFADPPANRGNGNGHKKDKAAFSTSYGARPSWISANCFASLPPGIKKQVREGKRTSLPPGIAKKCNGGGETHDRADRDDDVHHIYIYDRGERLPDRYVIIRDYDHYDLPRIEDQYRYAQIDGELYKIMRDTNTVIEAIGIVSDWLK